MKRTTFWIVFLVLFAAVAGLGYAMRANDQRWLAKTCTKSSAALEWIASPSQARQIVEDWRSVPGAVKGVTYGILIDFLFILFYVAWGIWTLRACAEVVPEIPWWKGAGRRLALGLLFAGVFDVVENVGILLELHASLYWLAPLTTFFAWMKWIIAGLVLVYVLFSVVLWLRRWDAASDEQRAELERLA